jgi:glycosyltransferase involved in cell wall biosynthesis
MDSRKISLVCPYYNRSKQIFDYLGSALLDDRINNIAIVDDRSPDDDFQQLLKNVGNMKKVTVYRNVKNLYIQHNKRTAISFAKNDFVVVCDNDNRMDKDFFDKIFAIQDWQPNILYSPAFGFPNFNYCHLNGQTITKQNISSYTGDKSIITFCNLNNFFVNRDSFLNTYFYNDNVRGADGLYTYFNWLKSGNSIYVVPDLTYQHRISPDSVFLSEVDSNMQKVYYYFDKLKELK